MQTAPLLVKFSCNNTIYRQTDGVSLGSRLGPTLANVIVGYQETKLFLNIKKSLVYYGYVIDTFAIFKSEDEYAKFLSSLNSLHSSLRFTFEKEFNRSLPVF